MVQTKKLAALLLTLLALLPVPSAWADTGVKLGTTVSGTVRVYLSSIASNTSVDVTIDGSYSIGGDASRALTRGETIGVSNNGGTLTLVRGGRSEAMGTRFKLRRHQTSGENGVRIAQARKPQSLYPGDIEFIAKGGNVQIIVHVYMEDYMRGVLPYEMDNSFPLEALKAQAVAARTYALKKMSAQSATYDLVDTTSDQVYNGTPTGNARCVQAVQETSGIVGTVSGEYMASYYTASNGGQTETVANAWGSGSYNYLQMKDDPYDLRNGASIAKSVTFYKDGTTSVSALTSLLRTEAASLVGAGSVSISSINSVRVHTPKYDAPSKVFSKVDVNMTLSGYGNVTVTLDYFNQIESLCALSINTLKNETLSVTETVGGFKLTARRFGHGVGMSQRGAQQMASEGLTYDQILEFYYPGLVRTKYTMTRTILPSIDGTVGGEGDGMDGPVTDARSAVVTLSNPLDSLNLRSQASTSSAVLATMAHGTQVTLLEMGGAWSRVQYGTLSGYVKNEYISVMDDQGDAPVPDAVSRGIATVALADESQTLNLRAAPTVNSAVLSHLRHGQTLNVLERYEKWTYVQMGTLSGYVSNDYIVYDAAGSGGEQGGMDGSGEQTQEEKRIAIVLAENGLNMRAQPSLGAGVVMTLPQGTMLDVTGYEHNGMLPVALGGLTGFVATEHVFIATQEKLDNLEPTPSPTPSPVPTAAPQTGMATVTAWSGLKLRDQPHTGGVTLTTMPMGAGVTVLGAQQNGFLPVIYGDLQGYASADYLRFAYVTPIPVPTQAPTPVPAPVPTKAPQASGPVTGRMATVNAYSGLNMRADSNTYADVIATLAYGVDVLITGEAVNGFYPVRMGTLSGYVSADYLSVGAAAYAEPEPTAAPQYHADRVVVSSENGLNLRAAPGAHSDVLYVLPYGMVLTVLGEEENGFLYVQWAGYTGYVSSSYVTPLGAQ